MTSVRLQCECGQVQGEAREISPGAGTRLVCYCDDCQAFPRVLGKAENVLDPWGGTDIYQMPQAHLQIHAGNDQLRCLRFGEKGTYRWYTACCNTPIGNTLGPGWPFIGVIHSFMQHAVSRDDDLGPSRGNVWTQFAKEGAPDAISKAPSSFWLLLRSVRKLLVWRLKGLGQPSPLFDAEGRPAAEPEIRSRD